MTAIACYRNIEVPGNFLPICNSSCVRKRQKITSMGAGGAERVQEIGCWFASLEIFILLVSSDRSESGDGGLGTQLL